MSLIETMNNQCPEETKENHVTEIYLVTAYHVLSQPFKLGFNVMGHASKL